MPDDVSGFFFMLNPKSPIITSPHPSPKIGEGANSQ